MIRAGLALKHKGMTKLKMKNAYIVGIFNIRH